MYLAFKKLKKNKKTNVNRVISQIKGKKEVRLMLLKFQVQETMYALMFLEVEMYKVVSG